jgi:Mitochondrial ribosomal protein (VAR1)
MLILNEKIKNTSSSVRNLNVGFSDSNEIIPVKSIKKGQLKHYPVSVKEWYNSIYAFKKDYYMKTLPLKDQITYKLFDTYFNYNELKNYKYNSLSMYKIFIGKPEIKHYNDKINITIYIFNKWITYFYEMVKISSLYKNRLVYIIKILFTDKILKKLLIVFGNFLVLRIFKNKAFKYLICYKKHTKKNVYIYMWIVFYFFEYIKLTNLINIFSRVFLSNLVQEKRENLKKIIEKKRIGNLSIMLEILEKVFFNKLKIKYLKLLKRLLLFYFIIKKILKNIYIFNIYNLNLYLNNYKFNIKNILILKSLLNKIYGKKIEVNIVNLKYLYLDGNILGLAVAKLLKDRKRRVLKVIRMALRLSKKPYIKKFYSNFLNINSTDTIYVKKILNLPIYNLPLNIDLIHKPLSYKSRIIFYYLKHKIISGMKLQGTGRLTKRLTASRSISKSINKGSLKNKTSSVNGLSTVMLRGYVKSNLQYININYYNRIGAYGIKSWISNY